MKHFHQLPVNIDPQPLLDQLAQHDKLWNADDSWTKGKPLLYSTNNIVLRYNKTPEGQAPGSMWDKEAFSFLDAAQKVVFDVMRAIPGEHLGKVMISKMRPGEKIDWHIDRMPPGIAPYWQRFQVPLSVKRGVRFCVADFDASQDSDQDLFQQRTRQCETLYMEPGTAWWFDNQKMHAVFNDSDADRISMFIDIRPFVDQVKLAMQHFMQYVGSPTWQ